jgi:hypothetical protein
MGMVCSTNGEKRNACMYLMGKPKGNRPLDRRKSSGEDNIVTYFCLTIDRVWIVEWIY